MIPRVVLGSSESNPSCHSLPHFIFNPRDQFVKPIELFSAPLNEQSKWKAGADED